MFTNVNLREAAEAIEQVIAFAKMLPKMDNSADESTHQILSYGLLFLTFYRFPYTAGPPTSTAPT